MKKLLYFLTLGISSMLLFAGCSDEDDANFSGDIVGKWQSVKEYGVDEDGEFEYSADEFPNYQFYLIFKSDGTMNEIEEENEIIVTNNHYNWKLSGNKLTIYHEDYQEVNTVKRLTETTLTLQESEGNKWWAQDFVRISE